MQLYFWAAKYNSWIPVNMDSRISTEEMLKRQQLYEYVKGVPCKIDYWWNRQLPPLGMNV